MDIHEVRIGSLRRFHLRHRHETDSLRPYALEDNSLHVGFSENKKRYFRLAELSMSKVNAILRKLMLYFWEHVGKRNQRTGRNHCQRKQYGGSSRQRFIGSFRYTCDDCIDGKDGKTELVDIDRRRLIKFSVSCQYIKSVYSTSCREIINSSKIHKDFSIFHFSNCQ